MSALVQQNSPFRLQYRHFTESDLLLSVSRIATNALNETTAIEEIASAALRLSGITGIDFQLLTGHQYSVFLNPAKTNPAKASAVSKVTAHGREYGQFRIYFDPHSSLPLESPVRLAKFIGQQLGLSLQRMDLQLERRKHFVRLNAFDRRIRRGKAVRRAAAVLAGQHGISHTEAVARIVDYAVKHRRPLLVIAELLIIAPKVFSHAS